MLLNAEISAFWLSLDPTLRGAIRRRFSLFLAKARAGQQTLDEAEDENADARRGSRPLSRLVEFHLER